MADTSNPREASLQDFKPKVVTALAGRLVQDDERRNTAVRVNLLSRVQCEFEEMPGLSLTLVQASRLFGLPQESCARVLEQLVTRGLLRVRNDGRYALRTEAA